MYLHDIKRDSYRDSYRDSNGASDRAKNRDRVEERDKSRDEDRMRTKMSTMRDTLRGQGQLHVPYNTWLGCPYLCLPPLQVSTIHASLDGTSKLIQLTERIPT